MTKEELNGKLLQRAEAIAQREEFEQLLDESPFEEYDIFESFSMISKEIKEISQKITVIYQEKIKKKEDFERIIEEIRGKNDEIYEFKEKLKQLESEKMVIFERNKRENEKNEQILDNKGNSLKIPKMNELFEFLAKKHGNFLQNTILKKQFTIMEEEEQNLIEFIQNEFEEKSEEIEEMKRNCENEGKIKEIIKRNEGILHKKEERIKEIQKWKTGVKEYLEKEKGEEKKGIKEVYCSENFEKIIDEMGQGGKEDVQRFKEEVGGYFERLEEQEKECKKFVFFINILIFH